MSDAQTHKNTEAQTHKSTETQTHKRTNRITLDLPEELYLAICARAAKFRTTKKDVIEELLRAGVRETANFVRLAREVNTPITTMIQAYKNEYDEVSNKLGEMIENTKITTIEPCIEAKVDDELTLEEFDKSIKQFIERM